MEYGRWHSKIIQSGYAGIAEVTAIGFSPLLFFSVPTERAAITTGDDFRGLGICHQQTFSRNYGDGISAKYAILRKIALLAGSYG